MVTTRGQEAAASHNGGVAAHHKTSTHAKSKKPASRKQPVKKTNKKEDKAEKVEVGTKRGAEEPVAGEDKNKPAESTQENSSGDNKGEKPPPAKKVRVDETQNEVNGKPENEHDHPAEHMYQEGTIERGHIYFFYRPKVELEEVSSVDDVQRFHILLVPRPPEFSVESAPVSPDKLKDVDEGQEMTLIQEGADAVPAPAVTGVTKKPFRLISVGKKSLPDPDAGGGGKGGGRKAIFWATVVTVGEDLKKLQEGLGAKEYETKTRGTRHQGPARIAARGAYAIINSSGRTPSSRETHLGYHISHPTAANFGEVQEALGIHQASSFVLQVKNPDAPNTGLQNVGLPKDRRAEFPEYIMKEVFGKGGSKGRESYGLRFAGVERVEMLNVEGAELLFIASRSGEEGLETSLGEGRGDALTEAEKVEESHPISSVLKELAMDAEKIPAEPLEGEWE